MGLFAGFIKISVTFAFLLAGVGFAGGLANVIGPSFSGFLGSESSQTAAAFLVVFAAMQVLGAIVAALLRKPVSIASGLSALFPMGFLFNRGGGVMAGVLFGWISVSVFLISLQHWPVDAVGRGINESSIARGPIGWVDRYAASIEISQE